jgi:hypothetical protein
VFKLKVHFMVSTKLAFSMLWFQAWWRVLLSWQNKTIWYSVCSSEYRLCIVVSRARFLINL